MIFYFYLFIFYKWELYFECAESRDLWVDPNPYAFIKAVIQGEFI